MIIPILDICTVEQILGSPTIPYIPDAPVPILDQLSVEFSDNCNVTYNVYPLIEDSVVFGGGATLAFFYNTEGSFEIYVNGNKIVSYGDYTGFANDYVPLININNEWDIDTIRVKCIGSSAFIGFVFIGEPQAVEEEELLITEACTLTQSAGSPTIAYNPIYDLGERLNSGVFISGDVTYTVSPIESITYTGYSSLICYFTAEDSLDVYVNDVLLLEDVGYGSGSTYSFLIPVTSASDVTSIRVISNVGATIGFSFTGNFTLQENEQTTFFWKNYVGTEEILVNSNT